MYLQMLAEREQIIRELQSQNFYTFEGKPLEKLSRKDLDRAYVRLPELKEVNQVKS
ncbi:hypothetical protein [Salipaludibacillus aurantiacus]|uniref:PARP alpha-helical domain-containing protein n=1 Tax=Salipaludibacillus aurantiacus TaxID=1601833 RepID=A0A1H9UG38_9BACI|nr:hypothetical protein [Salipaludibacillus aurantiacus]SES08319.1 hypothetical protein SAMN05518684_107190 [Salipaludibacillus aurantiacus]